MENAETYRKIYVDISWDPSGNSPAGSREISVGRQIAVVARDADGKRFAALARNPGIGLLRQAGTGSPLALDAPLNRKLSSALFVPELISLLKRERKRFGVPARIVLSIPDNTVHEDLRQVPWELCTIGPWSGEEFDERRLIPLTRHPDIQIVRVVRGAATGAGRHAVAGRMLLAAAYTTHGWLDGAEFDPLMPGGTRRSDVDRAKGWLEETALSPVLVAPGYGRASVSGRDIAHAIGAGKVAAFYFSGHHGSGGLVVSGDNALGDKQPEWFTADDLAGPLLRAGTQVVVLMACDTGRRPFGRAPMIANYQAFAELLVLAGIPWVVSAQAAISNTASQEFGPEFVRWLADGASVVEAAQAASAAMGHASGLMVIHCALDQPDPYVPAARPPAAQLSAELTSPARRRARLVNPEVRWGLDRRALRGILEVGENAANLAARLNYAEGIIRRGIFDFDPWRPHRLREWLDIDAFRRPLFGPKGLEDLVSSPPRRGGGERPMIAALDSSFTGIRSQTPISAGISRHCCITFPSAGIVTCVSGSAHYPGTARLAADLERMQDGRVDVLALADDTGESQLADVQPAADRAAEPDVIALAALRNLRQIGWRGVEALIRDGASTGVRVVFDYLRERQPGRSGDLTFLCQAEPAVVDAAWRAGIRPAFDPSRLPDGAELMPGCWTLLARSRLTPDMVCWLCRIRPELASVTGLIDDGGGPDFGHERWLLQVRDGYGVLSPAAGLSSWRLRNA